MLGSLRKYWFIYTLYWQEGMAQRASFFMERFRAVVVLLSFYYLWTALLKDKGSFAGYDYPAMMGYVLGMNILRGLVFAGRTYELSYDINRGQLAGYLLKPVNFIGYTFMKDLAEKSLNALSAVIEITGLFLVFHVSVRLPEHPITWLYFAIAAADAVLLYFVMSFLVGCWGFWTAESGGPRFLMELFLEFSAGAFFPLDVLSPKLQSVLAMFPSPYLVFFPLQLFLERLTPHQILQGFMAQLFWVSLLYGAMRLLWARGLRVYSADRA